MKEFAEFHLTLAYGLTMSHLISITQLWSKGPTVNNKDTTVTWEIPDFKITCKKLGTKAKFFIVQDSVQSAASPLLSGANLHPTYLFNRAPSFHPYSFRSL